MAHVSTPVTLSALELVRQEDNDKSHPNFGVTLYFGKLFQNLIYY